MSWLEVTKKTPPTELRHCPFCGAAAALEERRNIAHGMVVDTHYSVVCIRSDCRASINYMGTEDPIAKVIELWNRRNYD